MRGRFACGLLHSSASGWSRDWCDEGEKTLLALAEDHGVETLFYAGLNARAGWQDWPAPVREVLKAGSLPVAAAWAERRP